jgi:hypothetical protein
MYTQVGIFGMQIYHLATLPERNGIVLLNFHESNLY